MQGWLCRVPQQERHISRQVVLVCMQPASLTANTSDTRPQEKSIQSLKETPWPPSWLHTPSVCRPTPKHLFVHFLSMGIPVTSHTGVHIQRAVTELSPSQSTCRRGPEVTPQLREQAARCMRACGHSNAGPTIKGQEEMRRRITVKPEMD